MTDLLDGTVLARRRLVTAGVVAVALLGWLLEPLLGVEGWVGFLPTTVNVWESAVAWVPSLLCGFAAWVAGRVRAAGLDEWAETSPRSAAGRLAPGLVLAGGSAVVVQLVAVAVLTAVSVRYGMLHGARELDLLLAIPAMTGYLLAWTAAGAALGRSVRLLVALPAAVVAPYAAYYVLLVHLADGPLGALVVGDGRTYDYVRPPTMSVLLRTSFWLLLAVAAWAVLLDRRRAGLVAGWVASAVAALAILQGAGVVPVAGASDPLCRGTAPVTCLDGSHANTIEPYRTAVARVWGSVPVPLRLAAVGATPEVLPAGTGLVVPPVAGLLSVSRVVDDSMFAARFGDALFWAGCTEASTGTDTAAVLTLWWRTRTGLAPDRPAYVGDGRYAAADPARARHEEQARAFARTPEGERDQWFQRNRDRILTCSAPAVPGA